jgi:hypothetical protein
MKYKNKFCILSGHGDVLHTKKFVKREIDVEVIKKRGGEDVHADLKRIFIND